MRIGVHWTAIGGIAPALRGGAIAIAAVVVGACADADMTGQGSPVVGNSAGAGGLAGVGVSAAGTGGMGAGGMRGGPIAGNTVVAGASASGTGGGGGAAGSMLPPAGGAGGMAAGGAGGTGGAGGMDVVAVPGEPRIPEPMGECPDFTSGSATIAGLRTQIDAGAPGDTQGALLFAWHATAGSSLAAMSGVPASVRAEITAGGGIVVAAQGNVGGMGRTDIAPPTGAWFIEDLEFADQVVACAVRDHNIDPKRIHATGCSAGGLMSGTFGLMRSEYVASIAPNSGGINYMNSRMLSDTSHAPASFCMHGGAGDSVIVNFADTSMWFEEQNRKAANKPFMVNCNHGIGHCGAPSSLHVLAWEFMKAHPYDVGTSPWASAPPANLPDYCMVVP